MLQPCARCNRHIVATETACPFCGAPNEARPRVTSLFGRSRAAVFAACGGVALGAVVIEWHVLKPRDPIVVLTEEWRSLAAELRRKAEGTPILDAGAPLALQMFLQTHHPRVSAQEASAALAGDSPVIVAVRREAEEAEPLPV